MTKENEKRERTKESKEKESNTLSHSARSAHTHTREELQRIAQTKPTLQQVKDFAKTIIGFTDDAFIEEWYRSMEMSFWCDEFGNPIRNWGWVFNKWRVNQKLFAKLRDPGRIPDARKSDAKRKSDNWRGTKREEVGDVLG